MNVPSYCDLAVSEMKLSWIGGPNMEIMLKHRHSSGRVNPNWFCRGSGIMFVLIRTPNKGLTRMKKLPILIITSCRRAEILALINKLHACSCVYTEKREVSSSNDLQTIRKFARTTDIRRREWANDLHWSQSLIQFFVLPVDSPRRTQQLTNVPANYAGPSATSLSFRYPFESRSLGRWLSRRES